MSVQFCFLMTQAIIINRGNLLNQLISKRLITLTSNLYNYTLVIKFYQLAKKNYAQLWY